MLKPASYPAKRFLADAQVRSYLSQWNKKLPNECACFSEKPSNLDGVYPNRISIFRFCYFAIYARLLLVQAQPHFFNLILPVSRVGNQNLYAEKISSSSFKWEYTCKESPRAKRLR